MSEQNKVFRCIFCHELTNDYWFVDLAIRECRCHDCMQKGIIETEEEKQKVLSVSRGFVPVKNLNLLSSEILEQKKSFEVSKKDDFHLLRFSETGSLMEYSPRLDTSVRFSRDWKRGEVTAFSWRSRSRLNKKIALLSRGNLPLFVTLTYHEQIPQSFEGYKYHLHHFFVSLFRKYPKAGAIWKLEYQFRGYAHYHLFLFGFPLEARDFIARLWHEIAGYGSEDHLKWHLGLLGNGNEHCVQEVRSWNGVRSYASKYFSKVNDDHVGGRVWGVRGKVPFSKVIEFRVSLSLALQFRQAVARKLNFEFQRLGWWCSNYDADWLLYMWELDNSEFVENHPPDDPPDWDLDEIYFEDGRYDFEGSSFWFSTSEVALFA